MPAPATIADFLEVARKSHQIDEIRLEAYLQQIGPSLPAEPRKLATQMIRDGLLTVFQAEQFLLGKYKGFTLGNYRFLERLGIGATGMVYLAEHQVMKRRVAIKVLPTPLADDPVILERFRREAQASALLAHANVVHVYDLCQEGNLNYIVMEYIDGPDLQRVIECCGPLPVPVACNYVRQAALGLHHAHAAGLVHRDVKPANLLVDPSGSVKVLDLGLVRLEDSSAVSVTNKLNSGQVLGTADYLSPEQALNLHEVDYRADIYSLGATFYTLLAGQPPFHTGTLGQKLLWHQTQMPEPVHAVRPEVPAFVADVVMRMLAKKPEDRFGSAEEIADALTPWAEQANAAQLRIDPQIRAELRLARPGTGTLKCQTTRRARFASLASETMMSHARAETAPLPPQQAPRATVPATSDIPDRAAVDQPGNKRLLLMGALSAGLFVLVTCAVAFLLRMVSP